MNAKVDNQTSDEQLMLHYAQGQHLAFKTLYMRHKDSMWRFMLRNGLSEDDATELVQEIWIKVVNAASTYKATAKFTTWFYQIARNSLIDKHRKIELVTESYQDSEQVSEQPLSAVNDQQQEYNQQAQVLQLCLQKLPSLQRETFILKQQSGFTMADIAQITDGTIEACKSRFRYAVNALTACVEKHWGAR